MNWHQQRTAWLRELDAQVRASEDARGRYQEGKRATIAAAFQNGREAPDVIGRVVWHTSDAAKALESEERWAMDRAVMYATAITAITQAYRRENGLAP